MKVELISHKIKNLEDFFYTKGKLQHNSVCYKLNKDNDYSIIKSRDITLEDGRIIRIDHIGKVYEQYDSSPNTATKKHKEKEIDSFQIDRLSSYKVLKQLGFEPQVIFDCGASNGEWSGLIKSVFPKSKIVGIDATNWNNSEKIPNTDITEYVLLSEEDGKEYKFHKMKNVNCTGDSIFKENTNHYVNTNLDILTIESTTLEKILKKNNLPVIDLLKIDTQGSEILIMKGLGEKLMEVEFIELECSLVDYNEGGCKINEVIDFLKDNFDIFDIMELHRHNQYHLCQFDILFQNKKSKIQKII